MKLLEEEKDYMYYITILDEDLKDWNKRQEARLELIDFIKKLQKENEELTIRNEALGELAFNNKPIDHEELNIKDKVIDLMAEYIGWNKPIHENKEDIKEYFYKIGEEENEKK